MDRSHFFGIAARVMRQILVDHARKRGADKRKMIRADRPVSQIADPSGGQDLDILALHEALDEMAGLDPRQAEIVELRYFAGLNAAAWEGLHGAETWSRCQDVLVTTPRRSRRWRTSLPHSIAGANGGRVGWDRVGPASVRPVVVAFALPTPPHRSAGVGTWVGRWEAKIKPKTRYRTGRRPTDPWSKPMTK